MHIVLFLIAQILVASEKETLDKLTELTKMRETLTEALNSQKSSKSEFTEETFKAVCSPVGMELKKWSQTQSYFAKQVSDKYRNPTHKPNTKELEAINKFKAQPQLEYLTESEVVDYKTGTRLYKPIYVTAGCLNCHGPMESRPDFIKSKYPNDLAHSFKVGDLRGIFSVWIPNKK